MVVKVTQQPQHNSATHGFLVTDATTNHGHCLTRRIRVHLVDVDVDIDIAGVPACIRRLLVQMSASVSRSTTLARRSSSSNLARTQLDTSTRIRSSWAPLDAQQRRILSLFYPALNTQHSTPSSQHPLRRPELPSTPTSTPCVVFPVRSARARTHLVKQRVQIGAVTYAVMFRVC